MLKYYNKFIIINKLILKINAKLPINIDVYMYIIYNILLNYFALLFYKLL